MNIWKPLISTILMLSAQVTSAENLAGPISLAGWKSSIDEENHCHVWRSGNQIMLDEAASGLRISTYLPGGDADVPSRNGPVSVSFRGVYGQPDLIWKDIGYRTPDALYFDLNVEIKEDLRALYYFGEADIMDIRFDGDNHKFSLIGSRDAVKMFTSCLNLAVSRRESKLDAAK